MTYRDCLDCLILLTCNRGEAILAQFWIKYISSGDSVRHSMSTYIAQIGHSFQLL